MRFRGSRISTTTSACRRRIRPPTAISIPAPPPARAAETRSALEPRAARAALAARVAVAAPAAPARGVREPLPALELRAVPALRGAPAAPAAVASAVVRQARVALAALAALAAAMPIPAPGAAPPDRLHRALHSRRRSSRTEITGQSP